MNWLKISVSLLILFTILITGVLSVSAAEINDGNYTSDIGLLQADSASFDVNSSDLNQVNIENSNDVLGISNDTFSGSAVVVDYYRDGNYHIVFEGKKLYAVNDSYFVKIIDKDGNPVKNQSVEFLSVRLNRNGTYVSDDNGIVGFKFSNLNLTNPITPDFVINLDIYTRLLGDGAVSCEHITLMYATKSADSGTVGSSFIKKWGDVPFELGSEGYRTYESVVNDKGIDYSVYDLISWNNNYYRVFNATVDPSGLNSFLEILNKNNYDIVILNLKPNSIYSGDFKAWSDREYGYSVKFNYGQLFVNGNGATIKGKDQSNNFLFVGLGATVNVVNVTISKFNHCFINYGNVICYGSSFVDNRAYKFDVSQNLGAVVHNYNKVAFEKCIFKDNLARLGINAREYCGGVLSAERNSDSIFIDCKFCSENDNFFADDLSSIVIYSNFDSPVTINQLKKSYFSQKATFSLVRYESSVLNNTNIINIECNDTTAFELTVLSINTMPRLASSIVINLKKDTVYDIPVKDLQKGFGGTTYDWRYNGCHYDPYQCMDAPFKYLNPLIDRYVLDVGAVPIVIKGNGATINIKDNKDNYDHHFAFMGKDSSLTLENITFTNFNTVLFGAGGNFIADSCTFKNNVITDGDNKGGVLRSFGGNGKFINCTFGYNYGTDDTNIFYCEGTNLEFCKSTFKNMNFGVAAKNSLIIGDKDLVKYSIVFKDSKYINSNVYNNHLIYNISDDSSYDSMIDDFNKYGTNSFNTIGIHLNDSINKFSISDMNIPGTIAINGHNSVYSSNTPINNRFNNLIMSNFIFKDKSFTLCSNDAVITFVNCTFENNKGVLDNKGQCSFVNCTFINNGEDAFVNTGILNIADSTFVKEGKNNKYGVIYNNGGSVFCINSNFTDCHCVNLYNFATGNYVVINSNCSVDGKYPMSAWKVDLIHSGFFMGTAIVTFAVGGGIGAAVADAGVAVLIATIVGGVIGAGIGFAEGYVTADIYHDDSYLYAYVFQDAMLGANCANLGAIAFSKNIKLFKENQAVVAEDPADACSESYAFSEESSDIAKEFQELWDNMVSS